MSLVPTADARLPVRLQRGDHEFLPAALEILETPLSPVRSSMILTICAFVIAALILSYVGRIDIIAAAQGKIQPVGRTKTIQPLETGRVLRLAVANGQSVKAGDLLLDLDARESEADEATLVSDLQAFKAETLRRRIALETAAVGSAIPPLPVHWDADTPAGVATRETRVLVSDLAQLASRIAGFEARRTETAAEVSRLHATIAAQQTLVDTLQQRVDMRAELLKRNAESKASVIDAQEAYGMQATSLAAQRGQLGEAEAALPVIQRDIEQAYAAFVSDNAQKLDEAERRVDDDAKKLAKAKVKTGFTQIRSPIDGIVQGLTVTTPGQVVSSGEQIMQIVPAHGPLEIECYLPNGDAGFVRTGQAAVAKIQSFPFTDYGTIDARVTRVAEDAIPMVEADQHEQNPILSSRGGTFGGSQRIQNLVFPITLTLDKTTMRADGADHPLSAGMSVTVEIKTGSRRILGYIFSPLIETITTAFKER